MGTEGIESCCVQATCPSRLCVYTGASVLEGRPQFMDPFPKVGLHETLQLLVLEERPGDLSA